MEGRGQEHGGYAAPAPATSPATASNASFTLTLPS